jgi:hypothetical protein
MTAFFGCRPVKGLGGLLALALQCSSLFMARRKATPLRDEDTVYWNASRDDDGAGLAQGWNSPGAGNGKRDAHKSIRLSGCPTGEGASRFIFLRVGLMPVAGWGDV